MRITLVPVALAAAASLAAAQPSVVRTAGHRVRPTAYQGRNRGPEQTENFSGSYRLGRNGSVSVNNISGEIAVTTGSGDEVVIKAIKRTRADRSDLANVRIDVNQAPNRVDIRADHIGRNDHVTVDFTISMPATASVDLHSVSGDVKVTGVQGSVRVDVISGSVTLAQTPRVELAKSVSGEVELTDTSSDGDVVLGSVSGRVRVSGLKARGIEASTISGQITLGNVTCERLGAKSLSGQVAYDGVLARGGRYNLTSHSGSVRLAVAPGVGFELDATTFSGGIQSDLPLTIGGDTGRDLRRRGFSNRSIHATYGDGSAVVTIRTFSGSIVITKR